MKRILLVLAFLSLPLASYSSTPNNNDKTKKVVCTIGLLCLPLASFASPAALASATAFWAKACLGGNANGAVPVYKKDW